MNRLFEGDRIVAFETFHEPQSQMRCSVAGKALSAREFEVARAIAQGRSPATIANDLGLSVKTVSTYRARILEKMEMRSNAELAVWFERQSQPDYHQALTDLVALIDRMRDNSSGRWPEPDLDCAACTQGCAHTTRLCAVHAAKQVLAVKS